MQDNSKREELISQYRQLMKKIKEESNETKANKLKKQASDVHDLLLKTEFEDENIKRFNS